MYEDNFCNAEVFQNDELNLRIIGKDQIEFLSYQVIFPYFRHEWVLFESQYRVWAHGDLNPGPSPCKGDVITDLDHEPRNLPC